MAYDLKIFDADQVTVVAVGLPITGGYADGEFVAIEQDSDDFTQVVGTDGQVTRSKTNNRVAKVTISLMQSSDCNASLSAINNLDRNNPNGAGVGPLLIRDRQGTSLYTASKSWVSKPPDVTYDREAGPRKWEITCADLVRFDGGN